MIDNLLFMDEYLDWTKPYIKHKDAFKKDIIELSQVDNTFVVKKNKTTEVYVSVGDLDLSKALLKDYSKFDSIWFICNNTKSKISDVLNSWNKLSINPKFRIIFINLTSGARWLLNPSSHAKVIPFESLENSLVILMNNS